MTIKLVFLCLEALYVIQKSPLEAEVWHQPRGLILSFKIFSRIWSV